MINLHTLKRRDNAIALVAKLKSDTPVYSHVTIFADVLLNNEKLGHLASDGYKQETWSFYPADKNRKSRRDKAFDDVLPKWVGDAYLGVFRNTVEMHEQMERKDKAEHREKLLKDPVYTAFDNDDFPCNSIPFATALEEHVRVFGTDSIKSDDAKKILWVLMGQAYGQLATIDLCKEWNRLIELTKLKKAQDKLHPADMGYEIIEDAINELKS